MIYVTVDELAEMVGTMCMDCQKKMFALMAEHTRKHAQREAMEGMSKGLNLSFLERELAIICKEEKISKDEALSTSQRYEVMKVRRRFARRAVEIGYSFSQLGRFLGKHHTTIRSMVMNDVHVVNRVQPRTQS